VTLYNLITNFRPALCGQFPVGTYIDNIEEVKSCWIYKREYY